MIGGNKDGIWIYNTLDTTELMTGKDGKLFVEVGGVNTFLAEITNLKLL